MIKANQLIIGDYVKLNNELWRYLELDDLGMNKAMVDNLL